MEPVKGGGLATLPEPLENVLKSCTPGLSVASWGIRYAASLDHVFMVLSGMSNMEQMEDNISYMEDFHPLNDRETAAIQEVAHVLRQDMAYEPEALKEAEKLCPKHIGIVKIAQMLNDHKKMNNYTNTCIYYEPYLGNAGKAADCDGCGKCMTANGCLDIPAMLKEADETITHF